QQQHSVQEIRRMLERTANAASPPPPRAPEPARAPPVALRPAEPARPVEPPHPAELLRRAEPPRPVAPTASIPAEPRQQRARTPVPRSGAQGLLAAYDLEKSYGGRRVVSGVNLNVARGEAVGLLGPNGAGKTTCFYMVIGLVKADAGRIELDGHEV